MPSRKKNKSNKSKKSSTVRAPPSTTVSLAPDTTLGTSPASIPSVKAAITSVVASHSLDVQAIIKNNVPVIVNKYKTTENHNQNVDNTSKATVPSTKPIPKTKSLASTESSTAAASINSSNKADATAPPPPEKSAEKTASVKASSAESTKKPTTVPPVTLPKKEPDQITKASPTRRDETTAGAKPPLEPEAPAATAITAPEPAALVNNHASAAADPRNQEQKPMPVPKPSSLVDDVRRQAKKDKLKKKCIIL